MRVQCLHGVGGGLGLGPADILGPVGDLALQVGERHRVEIDDADGAHACRGQVQDRRAAQPARADHQNTCLFQFCLTRPAHFAQNDVTGVTVKLLIGECHDAS